jgi:hypothetical protein
MRAIALMMTTWFAGLTSVAASAAPPAPMLVALAPPPGDDARRAVAIGPTGQVYQPDGKGEWVRQQSITTANKLTAVGRAGTTVVATGEGVVYRLAPNGWSAIRLAQKGGAVMSGGPRSVAAVGRQLFALDRTAGGEPLKLAMAPTAVLAIGSGSRGLVVATDAGLLRVDKAAFVRIKGAPRRVNHFINDRWALVDRGVLDLRSGKTLPWPTGVTIHVAAAGPSDSLVAVGRQRSGLELFTLRAGKLQREPIGLSTGTDTGQPVGIASDRRGRVVVAMRDGRLAIRERGVWATATVREDLPEPHPGSPPATSP